MGALLRQNRRKMMMIRVRYGDPLVSKSKKKKWLGSDMEELVSCVRMKRKKNIIRACYGRPPASKAKEKWYG